MRGRHVHLALAIISVASLCGCEDKRTDVLDKWVRQEGRASPEDEQSAVQGIAAETLYSSPQPYNGSQSTRFSIGSPQWSSNSSRSLYNGFLKAFGLQQSKQTPRFLQTPQKDSSVVRRRSAKEITTPHIIHQVMYPSCCLSVLSPSCNTVEDLKGEWPPARDLYVRSTQCCQQAGTTAICHHCVYAAQCLPCSLVLSKHIIDQDHGIMSCQ